MLVPGAALLGCVLAGASPAAEGEDPGRYDVVWTTPGPDASGSVPLGNGEVGVNAWVEPDGTLVVYLARTDSWSDNGRLLKVGRLRFATEPALDPSEGFEQRLDLRRGELVVRCGTEAPTTLRLWVDANHPIVEVEVESAQPCAATATIDLWRTERVAYPAAEVSDLLEDRSKPERLHEPVYVEPDTLLQGLDGRVGWLHHNRKSVGPSLIARLQGLTDYFEGRPDPLLHRTFGAVVRARSAERLDDRRLRSPAATRHTFDVVVHTEHPASPEAWLAAVDSLAAASDGLSLEDRRAAHRRWWREFWGRSWIHVEPSASTPRGRPLAEGRGESLDDAAVVSRAYALQRYVDACAGRGAYPIKFNGSLFTVPHEGAFGDADYRRWGPGYWWQNTRLAYLGMCASGDFELLRPLFGMYAEDLLPLHVFRTLRTTGHAGAFLPECLYFWGPIFTATYGWTPFEERGEDKLQESGWHKREWVAGLELVWMMLDYHEHTQDAAFANATLLPAARELLAFFDAHYARDERGVLVIEPAQALETWWDCTNPMPEVAGLRAVTARLLALPEPLTTARDREAWRTLREALPELPTREVDGARLLAPAERFADKRNVENPELYAVFPFRLVTFASPDVALGLRALEQRWDRGAAGWRQDDLFMTHLGLAEQARANLVSRARSKHAGSRFPAFFGPNYDWVPDQGHGGVLKRALQSMLLQADGRRIDLLPAWPPGWDAEFRLHAPYRTVVSGRVEEGRLVELHVDPPARREDVVVHD